MSSESQKPITPSSPFIFVGEHPAIDFANTLAVAHGEPLELLRTWSDLVTWFSLTKLSEGIDLNLPKAQGAEALQSAVKLRQEWKDELARLVGGGKVSDEFILRLNRLLEERLFYEKLLSGGKSGFRLVQSSFKNRGDKLALAILSRQIALFLAEANLSYLHRCANTESCVLYFYDTTKNHRRQWCSVTSCGNRHKVMQFRKRQALAQS